MKGMLFLSLLVSMLLAQISWADIPETMSYQGILTNPDDTPVSDGNYVLTFSIYDAEGSPTALWTETHGSVEVTNGVFHIILGSINPLDIAFDVPYWLGITVLPGAELAPGTQLTWAAYSLNARSVADGQAENAELRHRVDDLEERRKALEAAE